MKLPCVECILLSMCKSLMIKSFIEDYHTLCNRCDLIREYLNYEANHKNAQISQRFFTVQDYIYIGKIPKGENIEHPLS